MKKLFIVVILALATLTLNGQTFGEFFMNFKNNDFPIVQTLAESNPDFISVMHFEPKRLVGDSLYVRASTERRRSLGSYEVPCGYINGSKLNVLTDSAQYWKPHRNSSIIEIEGDSRIDDQMQSRLDWDINITNGSKAYIYLVEDKYGYNNIVTYMFGSEGWDASETISLTIVFQPEWDADNVSFIVMVTDALGTVVGAKEMTLRESVTTGIEVVNMNKETVMWPNPAGNRIKFSEHLTFQSIVDYQGKTIEINPPNGNQLDISHLKPGIYIAFFEETTLKFVKK